MNRHNKFSEDDIDQATRFANRMRHAIRSPQRWAEIVAGAKAVYAVTGLTRAPPEDEVELLAAAFLVARHCSRLLPEGDPTRVEAEALLGWLGRSLCP